MEEKELNEKKYELLTDGQLKEVAGGNTGWEPEVDPCAHRKSPIDCMKHKGCIWTGSKCTLKPNS